VAVFGQILRQHGQDPQAVADVPAAWAAFEDFLQIEIADIGSGADFDVDGFAVQWGCWSWNGRRPALSFSRLLAIPDTDDPEGQRAYWQVDLQLTFHEDPALAGLDEMNESGTGFSFDAIGPARARELADMRAHYLGLYPQLQQLWRATPIESQLTLDQVD
jgi:hypothetical protein